MTGVRLGARLWWGLIPLVILLWGTSALAVSVVPGLPATPLTTLIAVPFLSYLRDIALALTCGALAVRVLAPAPLARPWAWGWGAISLGLIALGLVSARADITATTFTDGAGLAFGDFVAQFASARALVIQAGCLAVALLVTLAATKAARVVSLAIALVGASAVAFSGHAGLSGQHSVAAFSIALHIASIFMWVGGLAVVVALVLVDQQQAPTLLPRFSTLALVCVIVAGETGLLSASLTSGALTSLLGTAYGSLVLAKCVLLAWLIYLGWLQRSRALARLPHAGVPQTVARIAGVEFLGMGTAIAMAVVLSRIGPSPIVGEGFAPLTLVVLGIATPLVFVTMVPRTWRVSDALPEAAAAVLLLVIIEVGGVGFLRHVLGSLGLLAEIALLVLAGWAAVSAAQRSVGGRLVLALGLPVAIGVAVALAPRTGGALMAVASVLLAEVVLLTQWRDTRPVTAERALVDVAG